jgi:hypothetical protein
VSNVRRHTRHRRNEASSARKCREYFLERLNEKATPELRGNAPPELRGTDQSDSDTDDDVAAKVFRRLQFRQAQVPRT